MNLRRRTFLSGLGAAGALAAAPGAARAQAPGRPYRIAVWHQALPAAELSETGWPPYRAFFQELRRLGLVEGRNLVVNRYATEGRAERYEPTARDIVASAPDVIVPSGGVPARAIIPLTATIPIVVCAFADPVAAGFVKSLARPGGNVTGFTLDGGVEIHGLRLQILKETVPAARRFGYLTTAGTALMQADMVVQDAASKLGIELHVQRMDGRFDEAAYRAAFAAFAERRVEALFVGTAGEFLINRRTIFNLATAARMPASYPFREFVDDGGLMSYGVDFRDNFRKAAGYVARVLNGEKPGDLPIQQPTAFEMVINLKAATAVGITLPESVMIRSTDVIE